MWRITFFISLAFTAAAPLAVLAYLHSVQQVFNFVSEYLPNRTGDLTHCIAGPVGPSVASYLLGLLFYATHIPERFIANHKIAYWLDTIGGGSHAIWHGFIVLAISQHKAAIAHMRNGIGCAAP